MIKSNHQKYGFKVVSKQFRRCKDFIGIKAWIRMASIHEKWNGRKIDISPEIGRFEGIRFIETK